MNMAEASRGYILDISLEKSPNTVTLYQKYLHQAANYFADQDIASITLEDLKQYLFYLQQEYIPPRVKHSTRQGQPLGNAALDNHWKILRSFFRWCHKNGITHRFIADGLPRRKFQLTQVTPFSREEIERLIKAAQFYTVTRQGKPIQARRHTAKRNLALVILLLDTGIRLGECARLIVGDIHLDSGEIHIRPYSTGRKTKTRNIPISKRTRHVLWSYLSSIQDIDPSAPLFGMTDKTIRSLLLQLGKTAKVPHTHPHRFRHTFAIEYLRNGGDIFTLQRILGHSDLSMCRHYLAIVQTDLQTSHRKASPVDNWRL